MKKFNIVILLIAVILVVGGATAFMYSRLSQENDKKDQVYLITKSVSENTDFWLNAVKGSEVAATELGVEVIVDGPAQEIYVDEQIEIIREIIAKNPQAIAIAATDYNALGEVCEEVIAAGITLVTFDSDANMVTEHSFVATNNLSAAQRIGYELSTLLEGEGEVAVIAHSKGAYTTIERIEGFERGVRPFAGVTMAGNYYYTNNSHSAAYEAVINIVETYPNIKAIYATNEVTLLGSARAIKDLQKEHEILLVGFDMSKDIALLIEEDVIDVTMVQRPFNMGYLAVKEMLEVMEGKKPELIDTGVVMINKENMFLPENQKLIVPNVN